MPSNLYSILFGAAAVFTVLAAPANAADDVESKVLVCSACHGQNGEPINATTPIIWGQQSNYLFKELHDFHSGDRQNPIMSPLVKPFSLPELREVANYFAAKTWPAGHPASPPATAPEESQMCRACHGQNFEGGQPAPRLAGLSYDYLIAAMNNFADGQRTNNLDMPGFMKSLTASERDAMAKYIAGL